MTTGNKKIKLPGDSAKHEYFFYLTCGWDGQEIEGRIKKEDTVRYSAIKKIENTKPLCYVELTYEEWKEVAGFIDDAIDIKKDHLDDGSWTRVKQEALITYYKKWF